MKKYILLPLLLTSTLMASEEESMFVVDGWMPDAIQVRQSFPTATFVLGDSSIVRITENGITYVDPHGVAVGPTKKYLTIDKPQNPNRKNQIVTAAIHWQMRTADILTKIEKVIPVDYAFYGTNHF